ncbi:hypothetical protein TorRG33x02_330340, partial [Trema orientale]
EIPKSSSHPENPSLPEGSNQPSNSYSGTHHTLRNQTQLSKSMHAQSWRRHPARKSINFAKARGLPKALSNPQLRRLPYSSQAYETPAHENPMASSTSHFDWVFFS